MAEDHRAPEAGQLSRAWTRGRRETENCQRASDESSWTDESSRSWTVQHEMRGVLGRVSASAAEGFLILPIQFCQKELNRRLCPLQRRRERTQRA